MSPLARNALIVLALLLALAGFTSGSNLDTTPVALPPSLSHMTLIAHAGGGIPQGKYSNSKEGFASSVRRGYRLIETDISWTKNRQLVLLHDWDRRFRHYFRPHSLAKRLFPGFYNRPSKNELLLQTENAGQFMAIKMNMGLHQMDLPALLAFIRDHPDRRIVTDIKRDNIKALTKIAAMAGKLKNSFIPQIYEPDEYEPVRALGFKTIIFTAYRSRLDDRALIEFVKSHRLFALTVPARRVNADLVTTANRYNTPVFTHTLNTLKEAEAMASLGVRGIYTDFLVPPG